jgi:fermentation-respiration switch protein FrsA (DUF1100 family)
MLPRPQTAPRSRRTSSWIVRRLLLICGGLYFAPLVVLCAFQRPLIFHAAATSPLARVPDRAQVVTFPAADGETVTAYYGQALRTDGRPDPDFAQRPTLLFFYGKGGTADNCREWFQAFRRLDANILMPDYLGFGSSPGTASEANCYLTADAAYRYLRGRTDLDPKRIVIGGYSLGSGVAVNLAARETALGQPVAGLALWAAYTSMAEEAHQQFPLYPTALLRLFVWNRFDSESKIARVACPVLLVHSRADRLIPFWMSDKLAAACRGSVTHLTLNRADHADYFRVEGKAVFAALGQFLEKVTPHET